MKPWYDNYCFAMKALKEPSMYNSDMVLYFMNNYMLNEDIPDNMLDANIRTDYNKLDVYKRQIQLYRLLFHSR